MTTLNEKKTPLLQKGVTIEESDIITDLERHKKQQQHPAHLKKPKKKQHGCCHCFFGLFTSSDEEQGNSISFFPNNEETRQRITLLQPHRQLMPLKTEPPDYQKHLIKNLEELAKSSGWAWPEIITLFLSTRQGPLNLPKPGEDSSEDDSPDTDSDSRNLSERTLNSSYSSISSLDKIERPSGRMYDRRIQNIVQGDGNSPLRRPLPNQAAMSEITEVDDSKEGSNVSVWSSRGSGVLRTDKDPLNSRFRIDINQYLRPPIRSIYNAHRMTSQPRGTLIVLERVRAPQISQNRPHTLKKALSHVRENPSRFTHYGKEAHRQRRLEHIEAKRRESRALQKLVEGANELKEIEITSEHGDDEKAQQLASLDNRAKLGSDFVRPNVNLYGDKLREVVGAKDLDELDRNFISPDFDEAPLLDRPRQFPLDRSVELRPSPPRSDLINSNFTKNAENDQNGSFSLEKSMNANAAQSRDTPAFKRASSMVPSHQPSQGQSTQQGKSVFMHLNKEEDQFLQEEAGALDNDNFDNQAYEGMLEDVFSRFRHSLKVQDGFFLQLLATFAECLTQGMQRSIPTRTTNGELVYGTLSGERLDTGLVKDEEAGGSGSGKIVENGFRTPEDLLSERVQAIKDFSGLVSAAVYELCEKLELITKPPTINTEDIFLATIVTRICKLSIKIPEALYKQGRDTTKSDLFGSKSSKKSKKRKSKNRSKMSYKKSHTDGEALVDIKLGKFIFEEMQRSYKQAMGDFNKGREQGPPKDFGDGQLLPELLRLDQGSLEYANDILEGKRKRPEILNELKKTEKPKNGKTSLTSKNETKDTESGKKGAKKPIRRPSKSRKSRSGKKKSKKATKSFRPYKKSLGILNQIGRSLSPYHKLMVLFKCMDTIAVDIDDFYEANGFQASITLTSEELFPIIIYLLLKTDRKALTIDLLYIDMFLTDYMRACSSGFCLSTFLAGHEYVVSFGFAAVDGELEN